MKAADAVLAEAPGVHRACHIRRRSWAAGLLLTTALFVSPAYGRDKETSNPLTHGMVQLTLHVGQTTQAEVLDTFGAPNITTIDGTGQEVWVYDRQATVTSTSGSGFSIGMLLGGLGDGVAGGGGLGFSSRKHKSEETQRTTTLIIKFGADKKVSDFRSRSSSF